MDSSRSSEVANIGKSVIIKGELSGSEDLFVDGQVSGTVELKGQSLTIGPNGHVNAGVSARNVIVLGTLNGNIQASERVELRKSAAMVGDIVALRLSIEEGAYLKGKVDITKPEPKAEPPRASAGATAAATAAPAIPSGVVGGSTPAPASPALPFEQKR